MATAYKNAHASTSVVAAIVRRCGYDKTGQLDHIDDSRLRDGEVIRQLAAYTHDEHGDLVLPSLTECPSRDWLRRIPAVHQRISPKTRRGMNKQSLKWCIGFLVVGTALLGGCAAGPFDNAVPALRVTAPTGKSSIVLGSVHVGVEGLRQPDMAALFKDARSYVVESMPEEGQRSPARTLSYGLLDEHGNLLPARWAQDLDHREVGLLAERVKCNVSLQGSTSPERFVDVLLAMADPLSISEIAIRHCAPDGTESRDAFLALAAGERGVPTFGLELQSEVEPRRRQVREEIYVQRLKLALAPNNESAMRQVGRALNAGDYDAITSLTAAGVSPSDYEEYRKAMIDDRNEAWLERLQVHLHEGNAVINVGAAHLAGEKGLIALLRAKGYRVDRVLLQAA